MIEIHEVKNRKDLKTFIKFPFELYRNDPLFTPELIIEQIAHFSEKNPFVRQATVKYFIAKEKNAILGRIAAIINHAHIQYHSEKAGFFGFFEAVDSQEVASRLFAEVADFLKKESMELIRGPMNFSTNEYCGILVEGFQYPPTVMTPYNPPYYQRLLENEGFRKAKDLFAYTKEIPKELPEKVLRVAHIAEKRGIRVRKVNIKKLYEELQVFKDVYHEAWKDNWGFVPMSDEELGYMAKRLKPIVVPELMLIAEKEGEPVGFLGVVPDFGLVLRKMRGRITPLSILKALYYKRKIKDLRLLLLGVKSGYRLRGVDALLFREGFREGRKYKRVEFSWILEDNLPVIRLVEMIGGRLYRRFRVYEKPLL
jgi:hypothetical protein